VMRTAGRRSEIEQHYSETPQLPTSALRCFYFYF
jgi:hypothetical protein